MLRPISSAFERKRLKCLMCGFPHKLSERIFERSLIGDTDFCGKCFREIMDTEEEDLAYLDTICLAAVPDKRYLGIDPS